MAANRTPAKAGARAGGGGGRTPAAKGAAGAAKTPVKGGAVKAAAASTPVSKPAKGSLATTPVSKSAKAGASSVPSTPRAAKTGVSSVPSTPRAAKTGASVPSTPRTPKASAAPASSVDLAPASRPSGESVSTPVLGGAAQSAAKRRRGAKGSGAEAAAGKAAAPASRRGRAAPPPAPSPARSSPPSSAPVSRPVALHVFRSTPFRVSPVTSLCASRDGTLAVAAHEDGWLEAYDLRAGLLLSRLPPPRGAGSGACLTDVTSACLVEDAAWREPRLFVSGLAGGITEVDLRTGETKAGVGAEAAGGAVWALAAHPGSTNGRATGGLGATTEARGVDEEGGEDEDMDADGEGRANGGGLDATAASRRPGSSASSPLRCPLAAACDDGCVRLYEPLDAATDGSWGVRLARTIPAVRGRCLAVAWHPDGRHLAAAGTDGCLHVWDALEGREVSRVTLPGSGASSKGTKYESGGDKEGTAPGGGLWGDDEDADADGEGAHGFSSPSSSSRISVWALAYLPDGTLASGDSEGGVRLYDAEHLGLEGAFRLHAADVLALAVSPIDASGALASVGVDGALCLYRRGAARRADGARAPDAWAGTLARRPHALDARAAVWAAKGLLTAGNDGLVVAHDATHPTGAPARCLDAAPAAAGGDVAVGARLALACGKGEVRLYQVPEPKEEGDEAQEGESAGGNAKARGKGNEPESESEDENENDASNGAAARGGARPSAPSSPASSSPTPSSSSPPLLLRLRAAPGGSPAVGAALSDDGSLLAVAYPSRVSLFRVWRDEDDAIARGDAASEASTAPLGRPGTVRIEPVALDAAKPMRADGAVDASPPAPSAPSSLLPSRPRQVSFFPNTTELLVVGADGQAAVVAVDADALGSGTGAAEAAAAPSVSVERVDVLKTLLNQAWATRARARDAAARVAPPLRLAAAAPGGAAIAVALAGRLYLLARADADAAVGAAPSLGLPQTPAKTPTKGGAKGGAKGASSEAATLPLSSSSSSSSSAPVPASLWVALRCEVGDDRTEWAGGHGSGALSSASPAAFASSSASASSLSAHATSSSPYSADIRGCPGCLLSVPPSWVECAKSALAAPSAMGFSSDGSALLALAPSGAVGAFDARTGLALPWTRESGQAASRRVAGLEAPPAAVIADPARRRAVVVRAPSGLAVLDLARPVLARGKRNRHAQGATGTHAAGACHGTVEAGIGRLARPAADGGAAADAAAAAAENGRVLLEKDATLVYAGFVAPGEIVAFEKSWEDLWKRLPAPLHRQLYGGSIA